MDNLMAIKTVSAISSFVAPVDLANFVLDLMQYGQEVMCAHASAISCLSFFEINPSSNTTL